MARIESRGAAIGESLGFQPEEIGQGTHCKAAERRQVFDNRRPPAVAPRLIWLLDSETSD